MKVRIEWSYESSKGLKTVFSSEEMSAEDGIRIAEDLERTGRTKQITFIDSRESTWNVKELRKYLKGIETEPHDITVHFDGGFEHDTKRSGLGCAIYYAQNGKSMRLRKNALADNLNTNNEAEYAALHLALQELELLEVHHLPVEFIGDSQVVINQMKGEWPTLEEDLSRWADRIEEKLGQLGIDPRYRLVSRKKNREADQLATQALKDIEIFSTSEIQDLNYE